MTLNRLITRRHALYLGLGGVGVLGTVKMGEAIDRRDRSNPLGRSSRSFPVVGNSSLKQRAARKGLIYGADCGIIDLDSDPQLQGLLAKECGMLVAGFLKWDHLRPTPDRFNFTTGDRFASFARQHGMRLRGHTLVWTEALPSWFQDKVNRQNCRQFLQQHIHRVVGHYAGKMHSWDVVNEAIGVYDKRPDGLRKTPWLELLGPGYIDLAFRLTAAADPQALLVYNENELDYDDLEADAKRAAVLKLLRGLKSQGTPVHALGIQAHLVPGKRQFNPQKLQQFLRDVAKLGLKIMITEMDVTDKDLPGDIAVRDRIVAAAYEDYLSVVLAEPAVIAVITWGVSDRYTWLSDYAPRPDRAPVRPLPFDRHLQRKLAWNGIARAFDLAPKR
jgi:endo-1,4-beta-xylanase